MFSQNFNIKDAPFNILTAWQSPEDAFVISDSEMWLQPQKEGELIYAWTQLNDLRRFSTRYSRYNVCLGFQGYGGPTYAKEFHVEIRQCRSDDQNYVAVEANSLNNSIQLFEMRNGAKIASTQSTFVFDKGRKNWLELWVYDNRAYVLLNGIYLTDIGVTASTKDGFSIYVHKNVDGTLPRIYQIQARELEAQPTEKLDDADLWVVLRQNIRNQINMPYAGDYDGYKRVWMLWYNNKDKPIPDSEWWEAGYPLREPRPEEWGT